MSEVREEFERCFEKEFPHTYEAAMRGEPQPHGDMSCAWWGFKEGYRCALPTTEPRTERPICTTCYMIAGGAIGSVLTWILCGAILFR